MRRNGKISWTGNCDFDDMDLKMKMLTKGWKVVSTNKAAVYHLAKHNKGTCDIIHHKTPVLLEQQRKKFVEKWGNELKKYNLQEVGMI